MLLLDPHPFLYAYTMTSRAQFPRKTTLAIALAAALGAHAHVASAAGGPLVIEVPMHSIVWASDDVTITNTGSVLGMMATPAINANSPGLVGTLHNQGLIQGDIGLFTNTGATISSVWNQGTIASTYLAAIQNNGRINTLTNDTTGLIKTTGFSFAVNNNGGIGSLVNKGTITGLGGLNNLGTIASVRNEGLINATTDNAVTNGGSIGTLTNTGTISSYMNQNGSISGQNGVGNQSGSTIGMLINDGQILGNQNGISNAGQIHSLTNRGVVTGLTNSGLYNTGTIGTLTNTSTGTLTSLGSVPGSISSNTGLDNGGTIISLVNQGKISSENGHGLYNLGTILSLTNTGTITSTNGVGLLNFGKIGQLTNSGTISSVLAIATQDAGGPTPTSLSTLTNSGLIQGQVFAILISGNTSIGAINNSGTIAGGIQNDSASDLVINGGAGNQFGTLTGLNGDVGQINSQQSVVFGSGNVLLDSNIELGSPLLRIAPPAPLNQSVNNTGATVQVNRPITITGNYHQAAPATLQIGVSSNAATTGNLATDAGYGRLIVNGTATIDAGSAVKLQKVNAFAFAPGQRYVVVSANATGTNYNEGALRYGINGLTSNVTGAAVANAGTSNLVLTINSIGEVITPTEPGVPTTPTTPAIPPIPATIPNSYASLNGLAQYTGISDPALLNLFNAGQALRLGSASDANQAGAKLAPVNSSSTARAADAATVNVVNLISQRNDSVRLGQAGGSGVATGDSGPTWAAWGQAFGGHASQNQRDGVDGYGANFGGLLLGLDRGIGERWRVGGVVSYSGTEVDFKDNTSGNSTHVDSYGFMAYGSYTANTWYTNLSAGLVEQRYRTKRSVDFTGFQGDAHGRFDGQQYVVRAEAGVPIAAGATTITPLAALTYNYVRQDGYTETGGNGAALSVGSSNATSVTSDLGVKFARDFSTSYGTLTPELQLGWRHEFRNNKVLTNASFAGDPTGATAFTTVGASPVRDAALVSAGLTLLKSNNLSISARYELQAGSGFVSQAGGLRLRQMF
ncbi:autotransporter domain-containing protein [Achromobacter seleniivolatilans]|uniref:Autotransporter domain-containing protein n=1 Tax=Achromobacter seleniivolatilans TaxID=3047478 RepID=A0ABY9M4X7_9BURK|nr:autotransporter domain-containing protein [Achromobacter sp. R39]WMD21634.1 autotransporter domain-containing protein [Achromobacter sp. R39]